MSLGLKTPATGGTPAPSGTQAVPRRGTSFDPSTSMTGGTVASAPSQKLVRDMSLGLPSTGTRTGTATVDVQGPGSLGASTASPQVAAPVGEYPSLDPFLQMDRFKRKFGPGEDIEKFKEFFATMRQQLTELKHVPDWTKDSLPAGCTYHPSFLGWGAVSCWVQFATGPTKNDWASIASEIAVMNPGFGFTYGNESGMIKIYGREHPQLLVYPMKDINLPTAPTPTPTLDTLLKSKYAEQFSSPDQVARFKVFYEMMMAQLSRLKRVKSWSTGPLPLGCHYLRSQEAVSCVVLTPTGPVTGMTWVSIAAAIAHKDREHGFSVGDVADSVKIHGLEHARLLVVSVETADKLFERA